MPEPTAIPASITIHGPYEDALIAGFTLLGKIVEKQSPEVSSQLWKDWMELNKPLVTMATGLSAIVEAAVKGILSGGNPK